MSASVTCTILVRQLQSLPYVQRLLVFICPVATVIRMYRIVSYHSTSCPDLYLPCSAALPRFCALHAQLESLQGRCSHIRGCIWLMLHVMMGPSDRDHRVPTPTGKTNMPVVVHTAHILVEVVISRTEVPVAILVCPALGHHAPLRVDIVSNATRIPLVGCLLNVLLGHEVVPACCHSCIDVCLHGDLAIMAELLLHVPHANMYRPRGVAVNLAGIATGCAIVYALLAAPGGLLGELCLGELCR